tara:strand:+ start:975 stop:1451 length:477 start_codon:yes stop_codon:yes gene_type:complete
MCFGGSQPQEPTIQYVGPSESDIKRQEQALKTFEQQIQQQQADTASQIQQQIDAANARTAEIQSQYDSEVAVAQGDTSAAEAAAAAAAAEALQAKQDAAAAAGASYTPIGAYGVTASVTETPSAQTTEKIKPKKKPKGSLKISPTAATVAGSGLNIGV